MLDDLLFRLRSLLFRRKFERDLSDELAHHIECESGLRQSTGSTAEEAARQARIRLGGIEQVRQSSREAWGTSKLEELAADARFAMRQFRRDPGFTLLSISVLSIGIAFSTLIFALVDAALIRPLPYRQTSRLLALYESTPVGPDFHISYADYLDWKSQNRSFDSLDVYDGYPLNTITTAAGVQQIKVGRVSDGFFRTLGVAPFLGRDFRTGEDLPGAEPTVILSYQGWEKRYGKDPGVLNKTVTLDGQSFRIIGVLGPDFHFAPVEPAEFWITIRGACGEGYERKCHMFLGVGRLKGGIPAERARADLRAIAGRIAQIDPIDNGDRGATVIPLADAILGDYRPTLIALGVGAALLLLIAFVNVSGLLLVKSQDRRHEMAVRAALGASRGRQIRQFAVEGALLSLFSFFAGAVLAMGMISALMRRVPQGLMDNLPALASVRPSWSMIAFAGAAALLAALLFSLVPLAVFLASDLARGIRETRRLSTGTAWRTLGARLVVAEFVIAVILLLGAGLLGKSYYNLQHRDIGIVPSGLAAMHLELDFRLNDRERLSLERRILDEVQKLPGVRAAGISYGIASAGADNYGHFRVQGRQYKGQGDEANYLSANVSYFETVQARLIAGRFFSATDTIDSPWVVVINETMAKRFFPSENPIGKHLLCEYASGHPLEVVGVIRDIQEQSIDSERKSVAYGSYEQAPDADIYLTVRAGSEVSTILPSLTQAVRRANPAIVVDQPESMADRIDSTPASYMRRSAAWLAAAFAVIAALLTAAGLYGVISYAVAQRNREIAVRIAVGAPLSSIYRLVYFEGCRLVAFGVVAGLLVAMPLTVSLRSMLFEVNPWDAWIAVSVVAGLAVAALFACFLPALRASRISPSDILRTE